MTASRSFKHPGRYFYRTTIPLLIQPAPTDGLSKLDEDVIHRDGPPEPRVPRITDFPELGIVGVELSTSTMRRARTCRWIKTHRCHDAPSTQLKGQSLSLLKSAGCTIDTSDEPHDRGGHQPSQ